jgi:hypothetical protein
MYLLYSMQCAGSYAAPIIEEKYIRKGKRSEQFAAFGLLKGHGNEADFLGFLQKLVPHRSLTLPFELFHFWLRIHGDIRNQKTTPRLGESATLRLNK